MIRTPEPRTQAEILTETLAAKGITLGRRESLEVIAKISGYKGWNEYAAELKKVKAAPEVKKDRPMPEVVPTEMPRDSSFFRSDEWVSAYNFTLAAIGAEPGHGISAMRLANHFKHSTDQSHTVLAQAVVGTKVYDLVCRGKIEVLQMMPESEVTAQPPKRYDSGIGISEEDLLLLEDEEALAKMYPVSQPECVWISETGMPVREGTNLISTDPVMELRILLLTPNFRKKIGA